MMDRASDDAAKFFWAFSRFEFALKTSGFVFGRGKSNSATPDWDAFVAKYKDTYQLEKDADENVKYLLESPPNRQVVREEDGTILVVWEPYRVDPNAPMLKTLTDIVRLVRNNLFHGGKYGERDWDDSVRSASLMRGSTEFVLGLLTLSEELDVYFNDKG